MEVWRYGGILWCMEVWYGGMEAGCLSLVLREDFFMLQRDVGSQCVPGYVLS